MAYVIGLFQRYENAAAAVDHLLAQGYELNRISVLVPEKVQREHRGGGDVATAAGTAAAASGAGSAVTSGGLDNMLSGVNALRVAGVGYLAASGTLASQLGPTATAGVRQAQEQELPSVLQGAGVPGELAGAYAEGLKRGHILVAVDADDQTTDARNIMLQDNAADVESLRREWQRGGWKGFEPASGPAEEA